MRGIDIANPNGKVNIEACVREGAEFIIIRGGVTGYGTARTKMKDDSFERNYAECKRLGVPVGCYYYSCADTAKKGEEEAAFLYEKCLKGKQFEFPIYIDIENEQWQMNKKTGVTDAICAFCDYLESKGYFVGVYSSTYWFKNYIDIERVKKYSIWLADWRKGKPSVNFAFDMWQTGSSVHAGKVIDDDICYKDFPKVIMASGCNGFRKPGDVDGDREVTTKDARIALKAAIGLTTLDKEQTEAADMDGDGKVTTKDAQKILHEAVKG